ncbi:hypothetical protein CDCA_CDCA04G1423 [Cyanidium caldarium]|uniref:Major facilitator superfamily (MFS) profile domain-containing protein n=1 Tax=Cyanidium caldarium TaxID=2771 RepID=A0AAV9IU69_CYACA|nr:hypothetical protein CDCA_CDCA04G1423 [Cyanidium caldarium]
MESATGRRGWGDDSGPYVSTYALLSVCCSFVYLGVSVAFLGATLPQLLPSTGSGAAGSTRGGWLFGVAGAGYFVGAVGNGWLVGCLGGGGAWSLLVPSLVISAAALLAVPWSGRQQWLLALLLFGTRVGAGSLDVSGNAVVAQAKRATGAWMQLLHALFSVGATLAPLLASLSLRWTHGGMAMAFGCYMGMAGVSMLLLLGTRWVGNGSGRAAMRADHRAVEAKEDGVPADVSKDVAVEMPSSTRGRAAANASRPDSMPAPPASYPSRLLHAARLLAVLCAFALYAGYEVSLGGWLTTYAHLTGYAAGNAAHADDVATAFWAAVATGRLLAVPLSLWVSPVALLAADVVASLSLWVARQLFSMNGLAVAAAAWGLALAPAYAASMGLSVRRLGGDERAAVEAAAWATVGATLGEMLLPWIAGRIMSRWGARSFPLTNFVYVALWGSCSLTLVLLPNR